MARKCFITKKGVLSGNNVSHSNRKTRRRFLPNMKSFSLLSEALGRSVRVRLSTQGMRTIDHNMGIDDYLMSLSSSHLTSEARALKRKIGRALLQSSKDIS